MTTDAPATPITRLRPHPRERMLGDSQLMDLTVALQQLRDETHPAIDGHRQITLFHQAPIAVVLVSFEPEGFFLPHVVDGTIMIQVLEGGVRVRVEETDHGIERGQVLVLNAGRVHSVRAWMPSALLLTIHLAGTGDPPPAL